GRARRPPRRRPPTAHPSNCPLAGACTQRHGRRSARSAWAAPAARRSTSRRARRGHSSTRVRWHRAAVGVGELAGPGLVLAGPELDRLDTEAGALPGHGALAGGGGRCARGYPTVRRDASAPSAGDGRDPPVRADRDRGGGLTAGWRRGGMLLLRAPRD